MLKALDGDTVKKKALPCIAEIFLKIVQIEILMITSFQDKQINFVHLWGISVKG